MDLWKLSDRERLVAEQAVATLRALDRAAEVAPAGQGFSCLEAVIHTQGFDLLRHLLTQSISAPAEAQKRGSASVLVPAAAAPSSRPATRARS